ncbi:MAG: beta-eliminating lyase-related protein, partial [Pseudomonadota bacterium]
TYTVAEIEALCALAHDSGLRVHMDGARFANALLCLDVRPAEMSWKAGVDVLSFGTTKNGTINAEVVIAFDRDIASELAYRHKRAGLLNSKMRYMSAQIVAYLNNDLWLVCANKANRNAQRLRRALSRVPGVEFAYPTDINAVFAYLPKGFTDRLGMSGIELRSWPSERGNLFRLIASFCESEDRVQAFESFCRDADTQIASQQATPGKVEVLG